MQRKVPVRVTSSTVDHCSSVMSTTSTWPPRPALLTATSNRPWRVDGGVVEVLDLGLVGDVAGHGQRARCPGQLGQRVGRLAQPALVGVGDHHRGPLLDAPLGGGEPDAGAGRRGDHHHLALQQPVARAAGAGAWVAAGAARPVGHVGCRSSALSPLGSGGRPRTRSPMMFFWISLEPP